VARDGNNAEGLQYLTVSFTTVARVSGELRTCHGDDVVMKFGCSVVMRLKHVGALVALVRRHVLR
jgi:hypothetical protein